MHIPKQNRDLVYLGSSKKDFLKMPIEVQELFSIALRMALKGDTHEDAKPFKYHGSGVFEVVADHRSSTFRQLYTVKYPEVVYVIHIFQKKSKKTRVSDKKIGESGRGTGTFTFTTVGPSAPLPCFS
jgi:phage-related protein